MNCTRRNFLIGGSASVFLTGINFSSTALENSKKNLVPGIVHIDKTTRLQTVNIKQNKIYYNLIKSFYKKTGIPIILNTSFNLNNEPIVETPEDALRTFFSSGADILYLGNCKIVK